MKRPLTAAVLLAATAAAAHASGTFTLFGVGHSGSGDAGRRDDQEAFRSGLAATVDTTTADLELTAAFAPTTEGWLDLRSRGSGRWRFSVSYERSRRYSDTSSAPELLPSGTPVAQLFPFTNTTVPAFGDGEPVLTRQRARARLGYLLANGVLELALSGLDLAGERVPEVGGIAFAENGAPTFFPAGLASTQGREGQLQLSLRGTWMGLGWSGSAARGHRQVRSVLRLPTYGRDQLLEVSRYQERHDVDTTTATLAVTLGRPGLAAAGGVSYARASSQPGFLGGAEGASPTDQLGSGTVELTTRSIAASLQTEPLAGLSLRLAGRLGDREQRASGAETLRGEPLALARAEDGDLWRVEGEAAFRKQGFGARLVVTHQREELSLALQRGGERQASGSALTRDTARAEVRQRLGHDLAMRAWVVRTERTDRVDLQELYRGYAMADRDVSYHEVGVNLTGRIAAAPVALLLAGGNGTTLLDPPYYDPIYDPSWILATARGTSRSRTLVAHVGSPGGDTFEAWGELGWREQQWRFPEAGTFPGYLATDETVRGLTAAVGVSWTPAALWHWQFSGWLDAPSRTVEHRVLRAESTLSRELSDRLSANVTVLYRRFSEALYRLDNYTVTAAMVGVSGRF